MSKDGFKRGTLRQAASLDMPDVYRDLQGEEGDGKRLTL